MRKLKPAQGNWVDGDRFWDRKAETERLIELLDDGASVQLVAQRRIGKTSLMREVSRRIANKYICLHVDLQKAMTPEDAVVELSLAVVPHQDLWGKTKVVFSNILRAVTGTVESVEYAEVALRLRQGIDSGNWRTKGDHLLDVMAAHDKPVVIFFDEVPILINRILTSPDGKTAKEDFKTADEFMSWLRAGVAKHNGKLRVVLTGSIGLEPILKQAGLSATINNLTPFELHPWDSATAIGCLQALGNEKGITFEDGACEKMVSRLGCCIPHHVQVFFDLALTFCRHHGKKTFSASDAKHVYQNSMLSSRGHAELSHYEERLKTVLGVEKLPLALDLLAEAAVEKHLTADAAKTLSSEYSFKGCRREDVLNEILGILEHDGYLHQTTTGYKFVSNLLRDWWKARHRFGFLPAAKREA